MRVGEDDRGASRHAGACTKAQLGRALAILLAMLAPAGPAHPAEATAQGAGPWPAVRWGMSEEEVLRAVPAARRLEAPLPLADGKRVALGVDEHDLAAVRFQVRFVFDQGKLALVSLRTPERVEVSVDQYATLARHLADRLGGPGEETRDDRVIELRQTRWTVAGGRVDLKYIPGVLVVLYSPVRGAAR